MKLIELIERILTTNELDTFLSERSIDIEFDTIEVYMKDCISLDSEIEFFDAEKMPGNIHVKIDGIELINLFPLYFIQDFVQGCKNVNDPDYSDSTQIAKRLLEYWENDA